MQKSGRSLLLPDGSGAGAQRAAGGPLMSDASLRRLLDPGLAARGPAAVADVIVETARAAFSVPHAALLDLRSELDAVAVMAGAGGAPGTPLLLGLGALPDGVGLATAPERLHGEPAAALGAALGWESCRGIVVSTLPGAEGAEHLLVLGDRARGRPALCATTRCSGSRPPPRRRSRSCAAPRPPPAAAGVLPP